MKLTVKVPKSTFLFIGLLLTAVATTVIADYEMPLNININRDVNNTYVSGSGGGNTTAEIDAAIAQNDSYTRTYNATYDGVSSITDTNASTICNGDTTYLDGLGNCDDISLVYYDSESDLTTLLDNNYADIAVTGNTSEQIESVIGANSSYTRTYNATYDTNIDTYIPDTNASTACNPYEVLSGDGRCFGISGYWNVTSGNTSAEIQGVCYDNEGELTGVLDDNYVSRDAWSDIDDYPGACGGGQFVYGIGDALSCAAPPDTNYSSFYATSGWLNYSNFTYCADAQILKMDGGRWQCGDDLQSAAEDPADPDTNASTACGDIFVLKGDGNCYDLDDEFVELGDAFAGEVSGAYNSVTIDNDALDDQYQRLIGSDDWVNTTGDTMTGNLSVIKGANITQVTEILFQTNETRIYWNGTNLVIEG